MSKTLTGISRHWQTISKGLKTWEVRFIEMRSDGIGYLDITDTLRKEYPNLREGKKKMTFATGHLRDLLSIGGRMRGAFETYSEMRNMESLEDGIRLRRNSHYVAVATSVALLKREVPPAVRLGAAKDIQDRNEGKAIQAVEVRDNDEIEELRQKLKKRLNEDAENIAKRVAACKKRNIKKS
jgi:hypothetical protein